MGLLDTFKAFKVAYALAKKADTVDLQKIILDLNEENLALRKEKLGLKKKVEELEGESVA